MWRRLTDAAFLIRLAVACGMFLRVWHFACDHTIWYDESVLLNNIVDKDYRRLLGTLGHAVAAPPLFLWLLKTLEVVFGDITYVWRAVPFVFSVATLLLTVPLARRLFAPPTAALAVCLVAASDNHIWLGCTVKPYASDTAVITALLVFLVSTDRWTAARRLFVLAVATPLALWFSYPAVFALAALTLAFLPGAWRGGAASRTAWVTLCVVAIASFAPLYFGPMTAQRVPDPRVPDLMREWEPHFPNYADPWSIPWWLLKAVFGVFQQACNPSGFVLGLFAPLGCRALWRTGWRKLVVVCVGMFALAIVAAMLKKYPFGQHRLSQFLAPAAILLGGAGVGEVIRRWRWVGTTLAVVLVLVADGLPALHLYDPWHRPDSNGVKRYVEKHRQPGDAILSDEQNYLYFFRGELKPIQAGGAEVPVGGRAWVVMDFYTNADRRLYIEHRLTPLGFELAEEKQFREAGVYLYFRASGGR